MSGFGAPYEFTMPDRKAVAFLPSVVFELWTEGSTPGKNMPHGVVSANIDIGKRDLRVEMMIEFGGRVGMWRLLEVLEAEGAKCTVMATGRAVEQYPEVIREYHRLGHEICGHSYTEDVSSYDFIGDPDSERANIRRTVEAIETVTGTRPSGWLSPRATPSENTLSLLAQEGFEWCGDYNNDELPYVVEAEGRALAILPYSGQAVNDYETTVIEGNWPGVYVNEFSHTLDFLLEQHERTGRPGLLRASVHAHVYGRSRGRWAYRDVLRYAAQHDEVWTGTRKQLAQDILRQHAERSAPVVS